MTKKIAKQKVRIIRACRACGKPHKSRAKSCNSCKKLLLEIQEQEKYEYKVASSTLHYVITNFVYSSDRNVILKWFKEHHNYWIIIPKAEKNKLASSDSEFKRNNKIPDNITTEELQKDFSYLYNYFNKTSYNKFTLISVRGNYQDPLVIIKCKDCKQEIITNGRDIVTTGYIQHRCLSNISSGELTIQRWLTEQGIKFKTQRDTLKCINPKTHYSLPYDFEIVNKKIIIEVQGEQHYKFIPTFHIDQVGFQYQQYKDKIKKQFALSKGYTYLEIDYKQLKALEFKDIIRNAMESA